MTMEENFNEVPEWAAAIIERVENLAKKMDETFPEPEKKKPDFSKLRSELDLNDRISGNGKTIL